MCFTTTTHDITIYRAVYKPNLETIYLLRQVGDFALAFSNKYFANDIYNQIGALFNSLVNQIKLLPTLVLLYISMGFILNSLVNISKFPVQTT